MANQHTDSLLLLVSSGLHLLLWQTAASSVPTTTQLAPAPMSSTSTLTWK
jgi:hypothetical protein